MFGTNKPSPVRTTKRGVTAAGLPEVEATMPEIFTRLCEEQLDAIEAAGTAELVGDYFEPVSVLSLAHAMGIADLVDTATLVRWFAGLAAGVSNYEDSEEKIGRAHV